MSSKILNIKKAKPQLLITMTLDARLIHNISLIVHALGLSCLGGAIFLQILVFSSILGSGYFKAIEANPLILGFEAVLTAFSTVYFVYLYQKVIRISLKQSA